MQVTPVKPSDALKFFNTVGKLKLLKRTGWINNDIPLPESVADHMYRMSMLSFMITDDNVNKDKLMKICLVHDLAEAIVGDITPHDGVTKEEKRKLEETALNTITNDINNNNIANEIKSLWIEYEDNTTIEADIARQLDKFEMIVQANEYEISEKERGNIKRLDSFFNSTIGVFTHSEIITWVNELIKERQERWNAIDTFSNNVNTS